MREEYIKNSFEVDGVTVYESSDEFIFSAKNEKGEDTEHHIAKIDPFYFGENREKGNLKDVLRASVNFPNLPTSKALEEMEKRNAGKKK